MNERSLLETRDMVKYKLYMNVSWMLSYKVSIFFVDRKSNIQIEYSLFSFNETEPFDIKFSLIVPWIVLCELLVFLC
jgi:hypothetical protein